MLLTPHFFLILEVKNIAGTLYFDQEFNQLLRTIHEKEEAFSDPVVQLNRQQCQLEIWLQKFKFPLAPVEGVVIISNSSTVIKASPSYKNLSSTVIRPPVLPSKIASLQQKYSSVIMPKKNINKISRTFDKTRYTTHTRLLISRKI
nr:nuclease-related domain-containing protein [Salibacterium salarium]